MAGQRPGTRTLVVAPIASRLHLRRMLAFRRAINRLQPDVMHFVLPWAYDGRWEMLVASTIGSVAVVAVEHSPFPLPTKRARVLKRRLERRLDAHVAVSASIARGLRAVIGSDARVRVIHNGVPDVWGEQDPRIPERVLGTIARLDQMKGVDVLLRALAQVGDGRLIVVGSGPEADALHALAAAVGVDDRVEWTGWTERSAEQLARFDVFVLPTRVEGLALTICEAMLAGLPVIATDVGGNPEIVVHGETGILVPVDDPDALTQAITALLADVAQCARMGQAGRQRALELFTASTMARAYEALYDEVASTC
jgi:glycosyltransferase involved in cell wall biosynthesis